MCSRNSCGPCFFVFELADVEPNEATEQHVYKWAAVKSLGDHTLFLGPTFSKAVCLSTSERGGLRRNHIYYSHHQCYTRRELLPDDVKEFFTSSNSDGCRVYYKEDESVDNDVEGITSVGYYVLGGDKYPPMWLFPPDL